MQAESVKHDFPGWYQERLPSGNVRNIVRKEGDKRKKTTIPVGPEHHNFLNHYWAARAGQKWAKEKSTGAEKSLGWLRHEYLAYLERLVAGGNASPLTLKQRRSLLTRLCRFSDADGDAYSDLHLDMPTDAFIRVRNAMAATPAEADNMMKAARSMYAFAIELGLLEANPLAGIAKIHRSKGGAKPWTADDLRKYRERHPPGTMAHLYLTLLMFTGTRIGDAIWLGRKHEVADAGQVWLEWQPGKKGSRKVSLPILPPLLRATRGMTVQGEAYILNERGRPFKNSETLRTRVRRWCDQAGLEERSSHGVRKAMATLLSEAGCSDKQVGAILSHSKAATTAIYTESAQRRILSADAMDALRGLEW
ncbi:tyrosine-type recombinase/integrase [Pseudooceanicola nanhaiensis]|uniref:tyrosine-type recombinase/integrase n=1 Tax=Pseudooceanicola nanhaiensis TaxID=375761 RepID=UPI00351359C5